MPAITKPLDVGPPQNWKGAVGSGSRPQSTTQISGENATLGQRDAVAWEIATPLPFDNGDHFLEFTAKVHIDVNQLGQHAQPPGSGQWGYAFELILYDLDKGSYGGYAGYFTWYNEDSPNNDGFDDGFFILDGGVYGVATGNLRGPYGASVAKKAVTPGLVGSFRNVWTEDDPVSITVRLESLTARWRSGSGGSGGWTVG